MKNILKMAIASLFVIGSSHVVAGEGEDLYMSKCNHCHGAATAKALKAPEIGSKEDWAPRIAKGMDALMDTALNGSKTNPAMLPRGGAFDLNDAQIKTIVEYMVSRGK